MGLNPTLSKSLLKILKPTVKYKIAKIFLWMLYKTSTKLREKLQKYLETNSDKNFILNIKGKDSDIELLQKCLEQMKWDDRFIIKRS